MLGEGMFQQAINNAGPVEPGGDRRGAEARSAKFIMLRAWACPMILRSHVMAAGGGGGKTGNGPRMWPRASDSC